METLVTLMDRLQSKDPAVVADAVQMLSAMGQVDRKSVTPLFDLLGDTSDPNVERAILDILHCIGPQDLAAGQCMLDCKNRSKDLDEIANNADEGNARKITQAMIGELNDWDMSLPSFLTKLGLSYPTVIQDLIEAFEEKPEARSSLRFTLGSIARKRDSVRDYLRLRLKKPVLRFHAIIALGIAGDPAATDLLLEAFRTNPDSTSDLGQEVIALGTTSEAIRRGLLDLMREPNHLLQQEAACALSQIVDHYTVTVLIDALTDENRLVREGAANALARVDEVGRAALSALCRSLRDYCADVRRAAALALSNLIVREDTVLLPALVGALTDTDPDVRAHAVRSLGKLGAGARSAIRDVDQLRFDTAILVRDAATEALHRIKEE